MLKSKEDFFEIAKEHSYKIDIFEKVYMLLTTLKQFMSIPYLKDRLVLKGGTALNLFNFDDVPRLSVDVDLNYIGQIDKTKMIEERKIVNETIQQILMQNKFKLCRNPGYHAGSKMVWRYQSVLGQGGNIEIDINYMYRKPLWSCVQQKPKLYFDEDFTIPILDIHELTAGKLSALFTRQASRDLFDTNYLFTKCKLDLKKLRLSFVVYISMTSIDLSDLSIDKLKYDLFDIKNKLLPVLRQQGLPKNKINLKIWADELLENLRKNLEIILPLQDTELNLLSVFENVDRYSLN